MNSYVTISIVAQTIVAYNTLNGEDETYRFEDKNLIDKWYVDIFYPTLVNRCEFSYPILEISYIFMKEFPDASLKGYFSEKTLCSSIIDFWLVRSEFDNDIIISKEDRFGYKTNYSFKENKLFTSYMTKDKAKYYIERNLSLYGEPYKMVLDTINSEINRLNKHLFLKV